jgi:hypothetical protein
MTAAAKAARRVHWKYRAARFIVGRLPIMVAELATI